MANNFINDQGSRTTRTTGALQITDTRQKNIIPCNPSNIFARGIGLNTSRVSIYTLSDLGYSSNLIGSLSRANAALFTRYRVDNALSHKT